jgi:hypothetical protein
MSYAWYRSSIAYVYNIDTALLEQVQVVKDLEIIFDSKLNFNNYVMFIRTSVLKQVGFIKSSCKHFKEMCTLLLLHSI